MYSKSVHMQYIGNPHQYMQYIGNPHQYMQYIQYTCSAHAVYRQYTCSRHLHYSTHALDIYMKLS